MSLLIGLLQRPPPEPGAHQPFPQETLRAFVGGPRWWPAGGLLVACCHGGSGGNAGVLVREPVWAVMPVVV